VREPLVHFVALGFVLFGVDHLAASRVDDPRTIIVTADVDNEARKLFRAERGRDPDSAELNALHRVWLDNEVLYREGLALQVDRGDDGDVGLRLEDAREIRDGGHLFEARAARLRPEIEDHHFAAIVAQFEAFAVLVLAFVAFLLYGNVAPAIVLLALGVVFVVSGARPTGGAQAG